MLSVWWYRVNKRPDLVAIKNGIFLIRPSYMQLMKANSPPLANVIRSWQVSQDIENIRVIKFCFEIIKYHLLFVLDTVFYFMCRYLIF